MKFSIITVCRNAGKTIEETIVSVENQIYSDKEFIVIDGASTDETLAVVNKHKSSVSVFVSEPDEGIYDAMNKGVGRATGDYLIFINADDRLYDKNVLENVAQAILGNGESPDLVFGGQLDADAGGKVVPAKNLERLDKYAMFRGFFAHQAIFAKRELFDKIGKFDTSYKICADWDWILRAILAGAATLKVPFVISIFRCGGASGTAGQSGLLKKEGKRLIRKNFGLLPLTNFVFKFEHVFRGLIEKLGLGTAVSRLIEWCLNKETISK